MINTMRMGGIASGFDTNQIVRDLMKAERLKMDKLLQRKQTLQWQREDYRDINFKLRSLRDSAFNMRMQSSYRAYSVSVSNDSVLTGRAAANAMEGTYNIIVNQLASNASVSSSGAIGFEGGPTAKIKDLGYTKDFNLTLTNGSGDKAKTATINVKVNEDNIFSIVNKINLARDEQGQGLGIRAFYDQTLDKIFIQTINTGSEQVIKITDNTAETNDKTANHFLQSLKLGTDISDQGVTGKDSEIKINGQPSGEDDYYRFSTNNVNVLGMTLNLKTEGTSTITVTRDTDKVFDNIVKFINNYNEAVDTLNKKLFEERFPGYPPLTDTMKEALSEKEAEKWEERARSGLLRRDPLLSGLVSRMRSTMNTVVPGVNTMENYDRLSAIGITTTADYMTGKLVINEDKLREAINKDPDGVMDLFRKDADEYSQMGLARRLYVDVNNAMRELSDKAGRPDARVDQSHLGRTITRVQDDINRWEERLKRIEDRYWRQFTAMEKAFAKMNEQSMWLMQQFDAMNR